MDGNLYQKVVQHENRRLDRNVRKECVLVTFLTVVTKWLTRSHIRKKGFVSTHSLKRVTATMAEKAWWQEWEATGLPASTARKPTQDGKWDPALNQTQGPASSSRAPVPEGSTTKTEHPAESQV